MDLAVDLKDVKLSSAKNARRESSIRIASHDKIMQIIGLIQKNLPGLLFTQTLT